MADSGGQQPIQPATQQPVTILVKKPDGTFERKTLEEINALKKQTQTSVTPVSTPVVLAPATTPVPIPTPQPVNNPQPTPPKVLPHISREVLRAAVMEDRKAAVSKVEPVAQPIVTQSKENQTEEIVKKLNFTIASTVSNRLRTLIQLRLKDIRSPDQVHEALLRDETDGGVGLTDEQAEEVMKELPGWLPAVVPAPAVPAKVAQPAPVPVPKPVVVLAPTPSLVPPKPIAPADKQKAINTFIANSPEEPYFKISSDSGKPMMRDITSSRPMQMGPIDEVRAITLTDFRRLSTNPEEAAMRLKQKFMNLKDESVLLYVEALEAWKRSPLYGEYVLAAITSLASKQPLAAQTDTKIISLAEMKAIIGMEQQLVYV